MPAGHHSRNNSKNMSAAAADDKTKDQQDYLTVNGSESKSPNVQPNDKQEGAEPVINHAINEKEGDDKPIAAMAQHLS